MLQYRIHIVSLLVLLSALVLVIPDASAGSITITGDISASDQSFTHPDEGSGCAAPDFGPALVDIYPFHVTTAGTYTLETLAGGTLSDTVLVLYNGPVNPANGLQNCIAENDDGGAGFLSLITADLQTGTTYYALIAPFDNVETGTYTLSISGPGSVVVGVVPDPYFTFSDGRINRYDAAAPFAVYPHADATGALGLIVYDVYTPGNILMTVSADQIAAVPASPAANTLIASTEDGRADLYRLTDGTFQIQGVTANGKQYVLRFGTIDSQVDYTSEEID